MQPGDMLRALQLCEWGLAKLIRDAQWESLDVDYEPPRVERVWTEIANPARGEFGKLRVYLHRIYPCEKALLHPHPWPCAVRILSGSYEMGIGHGEGREDPPIAATTVLSAGSSYEMIDPNGWHYVRPLGAPSLSLMVTGTPWTKKHPGEKRPAPGRTLQLLSYKRKREILDEVMQRLESAPPGA